MFTFVSAIAQNIITLGNVAAVALTLQAGAALPNSAVLLQTRNASTQVTFRLNAAGSLTGSSLFLGRAFSGAGLVDCSNSTTSKLLYTATTGRFGCGTDQTGVASSPEVGTIAFSGGVLRLGDPRYVNTSGDTMTGALNVVSTISGKTLVVSGNASVTGSLVVRKSISGAALEVLGTASGLNLFATRSVTGTHLYVASTFGGAGLGSCSNATTSKLLYNSATKQFSCGTDTDTDTNTTYTAGKSLTLTSTSFALSDSFSGTTLKLLGTASGNVLHGEKGVTSSGAIVTETSFSGSSIFGLGLGDCSNTTTNKVIYTVSTGKFGCATDQTGAGGSPPEVGTSSLSGAVLRLGDARYVKKQGDTMTGTLTISLTAGNIGLKVLAGMSGNTLTVNKGANFGGSGVLISSTGTTVFNEQSLNVDFRIESDGNVNAFYVDASADRIGIMKNNPKATFDVLGTISGTTLRAADLNAAGAIIYVNSSKNLAATAVGTSGRILTSQGGSSAPIWSPIPRTAVWYIDGGLATGTGVGFVGPLGFPCTLKLGASMPATVSVKRAPEGRAIVVDIRRNGVSIFTSTGKPKIEPGKKVSTGATLTGSPSNTGGVIWSMNMNQVGSTIAGSGAGILLPCETSP